MVSVEVVRERERGRESERGKERERERDKGSEIVTSIQKKRGQTQLRRGACNLDGHWQTLPISRDCLV